MKSEIIAQLGQSDLLLPSVIGQGLAANDRVKATAERLAGRCAPCARPQSHALRSDRRMPHRRHRPGADGNACQSFEFIRWRAYRSARAWAA